MDVTDWLEIKELVKGAEGALISGQLNEWQHADCTSFHVLASAILDLNDRISTIAQLMDSDTLSSDQSVFDARDIEDKFNE